MSSILRTFVSVLCMAACFVGMGWGAPAPDAAAKVTLLTETLPGRWDVTWAKDGTAIERLVRIGSPGVVPLAPVDAADFAKEHAALFGIGKRGDRLELSRTSSTPGGTHYRYRQTLDELPIHGTGFQVHLDPRGQVVMVSRFGPAAPAVPAKAPTLAADEALDITVENENVTEMRGTPTMEPVIFAKGEEGRHAWLVSIPSAKPLADLKIVIDAITGKVLERRDVLKHLEGQAQVFDPNPVVTTGDTSLTDQNDSASAVPNAAYFDVQLPDVDNSGYLFGTYVSTTDPNSPSGLRRADGDFRFDRGNDAFEPVMAYYHLDRTSRYMVGIGFGQIVSSPVRVFPRGIEDDNSFYSGINETITFGTGGVDDAEDADILNHEFGHYIQDRQVKGFGSTIEGGSLGEGFGDYWAMSRRITDVFQPFVGVWDATSYSSDNPPHLRRMDLDKQYPDDLANEVHLDGEIWSAALYEVFQDLGGETTDRIVLESHELLDPSSGFMEGSLALYTADQTVNGGNGREAIVEALTNHGLHAYASAGEDTFVQAGESVRLQGEGTYIGRPHTLTWQQISGLDVNYQASADGELTFTAPAAIDGVEALEFGFAVTGESGEAIRSDTVMVFVVAPEAYQTDQPGRQIPDDSQTGVTSQVTVSQTEPITGIGVMVNVTHTYTGDLEVELTSPSGTSSLLKSPSLEEPGVNLHLLAFTSFDNPSSEALLPFLTESPQGNWRLKVSDRLAEDTGTFDDWGLFVMTGESDFIVVRPRTPIPDEGSIDSTLEVTSGGLIEGLQVYLDILHTYIGDLRVQLTSPDGVTVTLHNQSGGSGGRLTAIYHPERDSTRALPGLQDFNGHTAAGTWRLSVADRAAVDTGTLIGWGINLRGESGESELGAAVDNSSLSWTTGGGAPWIRTTDTSHDGTDSARSGQIGDGQESWMQTTVEGPGIVEFYWAVSSQGGRDHLEFYIDDSRLEQISGIRDWVQSTHDVGPGSHTLRWRYVKDSRAIGGLDAGWVDQVVWMPEIPLAVTSFAINNGAASTSSRTVTLNNSATGDPTHYMASESPSFGDASWEPYSPAPSFMLSTGEGQKHVYFKVKNAEEETDPVSDDILYSTAASPLADAVDSPSLSLTTGGNADWFRTTSTSHDGVDSAESGDITHSQESWMQTTVTGPGQISFWWKVSSENGFDPLRFYIDSTSVASISGSRNWEQKTFSVASGSHTLRWRYSKDGSVNIGSDAGWVDEVSWTEDGTGGPDVRITRLYMVLDDGGGSFDDDVEVTTVQAGDQIRFRADIVNDGSQPASTHSNTVLIDSAELSSGSTDDPLEPGEDLTWRSIAWTATVGTHEIEWTFTVPGDTDDSNNQDSMTVVVQPPGENVLDDAVDNSSLSFTTGGHANWFRTTSTSHDGVDSAESGNITDGQESWMQTTVTGPGDISFYWKVSSESGFDPLRFYIDSTSVASISGTHDWEQKTFGVPSGSHTLKWRYSKDGSVSNGSDAGWVDEVVWGGTENTLGDAVDTALLSLTTGGSVDWFRTTSTSHDGIDSAESGNITDGQESWMQTTVTGPGDISFYWKVSSESGFDPLRFYIDSTSVASISGTHDWEQKTFSVPSGSHTLKWRYSKDGSVSNGSDAGWVDEVVWSGGGGIAVERSFSPPGFSRAGQTIAVNLQSTLEAGITLGSLAVTETVPAPWTPTDISSGGVYTSSTGEIRWFLLSDFDTPLTYALIVPSDAPECSTFAGTFNYLSGGETGDGSVSGESELCVAACPAHPVDGDGDFQITIQELLEGVAAWQRGDPTPTINQLLSAVNIWQRGEAYECDDDGNYVPSAGANGKARGVVLAAEDSEGIQTGVQAVRDLPDNCTPGQAFTVAIQLTSSGDVLGLGVEETVPEGWTVANISDGGQFSSITGSLRWFLLSGFDTTLSYDVTPASASGDFTGTTNALLATGEQATDDIGGD